MGEKSPEYCAKQGPVLSRSLRAAADAYFGWFFSSKRAELLGEQKGVLALSVKSLHFMLEKNVDMCRGRDHLMF